MEKEPFKKMWRDLNKMYMGSKAENLNSHKIIFLFGGR
jgi:hypothetical protein